MKTIIPALLFSILLFACKKDDEQTELAVLPTYVLPNDTLFPEGIAYDPATQNFFTGSVTNGDIIRVSISSGATTIFAKGDLQNRKAATGMKIDPLNRLWVCGGSDNKIHVLSADGSVINTWNTQTMFGSGFINDVALDGTHAYFTDSRTPKIYRANISTSTPGTPEEWLTFSDTDVPYTPTGTNANGIVVTPGGSYLIIVVSSSGKLYRINKNTKAITEIALNTPVASGDGLYLDGNILYVSRNATNQIFPVELTQNFTQGTVGAGFGTGLLFNTTITKVGKYLLAVNGQLNRRATSTQVLPFSVSRVDIP